MTERERLIDLLEEENAFSRFMTDDERREKLADYLLLNGVICPPCKVGDTVWIVDIYHNYVEKYTVGEIDMYENGDITVIEFKVYNYFALIHRRGFTVDYFGKTVFLSREEAEQKLKELRE